MRFPTFVALGAALIAPVASGAALFDGKSTAICATLEAVQCASQPGQSHMCARGMASGLNIPQFLRVDFGAKRVTATEESGVSTVSTITTVTHGKGHIVAQGVDDGHGWSLVLDEDTGRMTASAIGEQDGVMIFGACTPL